MDTTTADALIGRALDGRYRIDARIARGGMATVYAALDTRLDRPVAVKVLRKDLAEDDSFVERFRREARSAARLSHPGVVAVYDQGEDDGVVYLVMEQVPGRTLRDLLRERGSLPAAEALRILDGVLSALAAAHAAGIVHRDVKPENVLLDGPHVKVADFGLARAIEVTEHTLADGALIGSVAYLAPEQVTTGAADPRTDVYAAGVVLVELLTGAAPFTGDTPLAVAYRHVQEDVPLPSTLTDVPPGVDDLVRSAAAREPDARFPDAATMLSAVRRVRATLGPATGSDTSVLDLADAPTLVVPIPGGRPPKKPAAAPPAPRPKRRHRKAMVVAILVGLVLGGAGGVGWYLGSGRFVDAPTFLGLDKTAAEALAAREGFDVTYATPRFDEEVAAGKVLDQDPDPGDRVRRDGSVTLVLSRGKDRVRVEDVRNRPYAEAEQILLRGRLQPRGSEVFHDDVERGRVVSLDPAPGTEVKPGTVVKVAVSKGPEPVPVPDLRGFPEADARSRLTGLGLQVAVERAFHDHMAEGRVISHDPAGGATSARGRTVTLLVSRGPELVVVPNLDGMTRSEAREALAARGLNVRFYGPNGDNRRVFEQTPDAGSRVRPGTTVDCYVF